LKKIKDFSRIFIVVMEKVSEHVAERQQEMGKEHLLAYL
jgi:hypothetical protein